MEFPMAREARQPLVGVPCRANMLDALAHTLDQTCEEHLNPDGVRRSPIYDQLDHRIVDRRYRLVTITANPLISPGARLGS